MIRSIPVRVTAIAAVVLAVISIGPAALAKPGSGRAPGLSCGAVITEEARLTRDLVCRGGTALTIRGDVHLDLAGHRIVGPGAGSGVAAIVLDGVESTVTITGGTIRDWGTGIAGDLSSHQNLVVRDATFKRNGVAIDGMINNVRIHRARFADNDMGIFGFESVVTIEDSTFVGNTTAVGAGMEGRIAITRSALVNNGVAVDCTEVWCTVTRSQLRDNGTAVRAWWSHMDVSDNTVARSDTGIYVSFGTSGTIERNVFRDNTVGVEAGFVDRTTIRGNTFRGNETGFLTRTAGDQPNEASTLVEGNTFSRNTDGIHSVAIGVQFARNVATHNTGWGIYTEGAVDLGGNKARHNGNQPQCVGIVCNARS